MRYQQKQTHGESTSWGELYGGPWRVMGELLAGASYTADHGESWASLGEFGRVHGGPQRVLRRVFHTGRHFRSIWANFAEKGRVP